MSNQVKPLDLEAHWVLVEVGKVKQVAPTKIASNQQSHVWVYVKANHLSKLLDFNYSFYSNNQFNVEIETVFIHDINSLTILKW